MSAIPAFVKQHVTCPACYGAGVEAPINDALDQWYTRCELCLGLGKVPPDLAKEFNESYENL